MMSSRLDRRRAAPSRCRSGGLRVTSLRRRSPQKWASRRAALSQGVHPPALPTGRNRPDTSQVIHAGYFSCTAVWPHRWIASRDIDLRARRCNGAPFPFQRCRSAAARQSSLHPGACEAARERQRSVTSAGMPWCGLMLSSEVRRRAFVHSRHRSPRSPGLPDIDGFRPKPVAYRHAGTSC